MYICNCIASQVIAEQLFEAVVLVGRCPSLVCISVSKVVYVSSCRCPVRVCVMKAKQTSEKHKVDLRWLEKPWSGFLFFFLRQHIGKLRESSKFSHSRHLLIR